ncbi:hypothetical protein [Comamonas sp.]|uniref:hypothetical protein n=1 Tax=Comamonas sp. TaxID=34028 RepID=UPI002FCACF13
MATYQTMPAHRLSEIHHSNIQRTMVVPLLHLGSHIKFIASPAFLLAPFNIYDREESLGLELAAYDPNDPEQLLQLLDIHFFPLWNQGAWTAAHKVALIHALHSALQNPQYDFASLLEDDDNDCFYLPGSWHIQSPRQFFLSAHAAMQAHLDEESDCTPLSDVN